MTDKEFIEYLLKFITEDQLGERHTAEQWDNINAEMQKRGIQWDDLK